MLLAAAVLTASISVDIDLSGLIRRANQAPKATCNITTVGYRFRGRPGQEFRYAGDTYRIPAEGWVELIADRRRTTFAVGTQTFPIVETPRDPFGFRDVALPTDNTTAEGETK
jgi:hypothetical protein